MPLPRRQLGSADHPLDVPAMGLGTMGMTAFYTGSNPVSKEECVATIKRAIELGCTMFDTAELYNVGKEKDNNEQLLGEALQLAGVPRDEVTVCTKWGIFVAPDGQYKIDGTRAHCREAIQRSLRYLGLDYVDLYYLHRKDPATPIEESVRAMKELVEEGKVKHIGLSEASAEDLRKAHAIYPITAYQLEWSLWSRDAEDEIIPTCRELGIGIVAYSPLGRGFLSGQIRSPDDLAEDDYRRVGQPRFAEEAFKKNLELVERLQGVAKRKGCTVSQLALAWVLARGPDVVPIPGTRRVKYLEENLGAAGVQLSQEDLKELDEAFPHQQVVGKRYAAAMMASTFHYGSAQK
ncbi:hypothetical protein ABPG77_004754 [Micractinium sp. CCAP 211/92]